MEKWQKLGKNLKIYFTIHIFHNPSSLNARVFAEEQREMADLVDYPDYCYALEQSTKAMLAKPLKDLLVEIHVPVQIIWESNDQLVPSFYARKFHELLPGSEIAMISRCGHVPQMENPKNSTICFWISCFAKISVRRARLAGWNG